MSGLPSYIGGARVDPDDASPTISSIDGAHAAHVAETTLGQLRRALRHADACQARLVRIPLRERIAAAQLVLREYEAHADEACRALAAFRGLTASDTRWMCSTNVRWGERLDTMVDLMFGGASVREVSDAGQLTWQSKGKACLFSSSTMDGPAAVVALCHAMVAGTHLLFKPSFNDAATHLAFEVLHRHGLDDYAQLVRWRSQHPEAPALNRTILANVAQSVIFASTETYVELLNGVAEPGSAAWEALHQHTTRYGTGLPLAIVTARADLARAAHDLVEGARLGGGRFCLSNCPVLVEESVHDALLTHVLERAARLRRGPPLAPETELSGHEPALTPGLREALATFGGRIAHGEVRESDMDLIVLAHVPESSPALHRELPGPVLALMPMPDLARACVTATAALRRNHREAWTAVVTFGSDDESARIRAEVPSYRYLRGGVVAQVKLVLPHQGSYFALDLMRRVSLE